MYVDVDRLWLWLGLTFVFSKLVAMCYKFKIMSAKLCFAQVVLEAIGIGIHHRLNNNKLSSPWCIFIVNTWAVNFTCIYMYSRCLLALKSLFILFLGFRPSNMTCQEQLDQTCFEKLNTVNESVINKTTDVATTTVAPNRSFGSHFSEFSPPC